MMPKPLFFGTGLITSVLVVFDHLRIVEYVNSLRKDWSKRTMAAVSFYRNCGHYIL